MSGMEFGLLEPDLLVPLVPVGSLPVVSRGVPVELVPMVGSAALVGAPGSELPPVPLMQPEVISDSVTVSTTAQIFA